jgi:hypothetical protein
MTACGSVQVLVCGCQYRGRVDSDADPHPFADRLAFQRGGDLLADELRRLRRRSKGLHQVGVDVVVQCVQVRFEMLHPDVGDQLARDQRAQITSLAEQVEGVLVTDDQRSGEPTGQSAANRVWTSSASGTLRSV